MRRSVRHDGERDPMPDSPGTQASYVRDSDVLATLGFASTPRGTSLQEKAAALRDASRPIFARLRWFWVIEILWCLVGVGCAVAIVVVLAQFDGKEPPAWPVGITLNTFLAFLASLAKAALLIPVTEGIGQLRWIWYSHRAHPASDLEVFDAATRGTISGLTLLLSFKGG